MARMRVVVTVNENPVSLILRLYHYGRKLLFIANPIDAIERVLVGLIN